MLGWDDDYQNWTQDPYIDERLDVVRSDPAGVSAESLEIVLPDASRRIVANIQGAGDDRG